ncbi:hypothetical protein VTN96DRAFT_4193 [Rasamsonia emersonii]
MGRAQRVTLITSSTKGSDDDLTYRAGACFPSGRSGMGASAGWLVTSSAGRPSLVRASGAIGGFRGSAALESPWVQRPASVPKSPSTPPAGKACAGRCFSATNPLHPHIAIRKRALAAGERILSLTPGQPFRQSFNAQIKGTFQSAETRSGLLAWLCI